MVATAALSLASPARVRAGEAEQFVAASVARLPAGDAVQLDLAALTDLDSSAVAALLAILRQARARSCALQCVNAGPNLRKLAALYGVDRILFGLDRQGAGASAN